MNQLIYLHPSQLHLHPHTLSYPIASLHHICIPCTEDANLTELFSIYFHPSQLHLQPYIPSYQSEHSSMPLWFTTSNTKDANLTQIAIVEINHLICPLSPPHSLPASLTPTHTLSEQAFFNASSSYICTPGTKDTNLNQLIFLYPSQVYYTPIHTFLSERAFFNASSLLLSTTSVYPGCQLDQDKCSQTQST